MIDRKTIRSYFDDFRYLASTDEPNIIREFVRYEDVVKMIQDLFNKENNAQNVDK